MSISLRDVFQLDSELTSDWVSETAYIPPNLNAKIDPKYHSHSIHCAFVYDIIKGAVRQAVHLPYIHDFPYGIKVFIFSSHSCYHYIREVNIRLVGKTKSVQVRGQGTVAASQVEDFRMWSR